MRDLNAYLDSNTYVQLYCGYGTGWTATFKRNLDGTRVELEVYARTYEQAIELLLDRIEQFAKADPQIAATNLLAASTSSDDRGL